MGSEITKCYAMPKWPLRGVKLANEDEDFEIDFDPNSAEIDQQSFNAVAKIPSDEIKAYVEEMSQQLINPADWNRRGKGSKRQIAINQSAKKRAAKKIYEVTKGFHNAIPLNDIFLALSTEGLVPIDEDGKRWAGILMGGAECGTDKARAQYANIPIAAKNAEGIWCMTTAVLHITWCTMHHTGRYEVVCYLS
jgi:hypothetical protein